MQVAGCRWTDFDISKVLKMPPSNPSESDLDDEPRTRSSPLTTNPIVLGLDLAFADQALENQFRKLHNKSQVFNDVRVIQCSCLFCHISQSLCSFWAPPLAYIFFLFYLKTANLPVSWYAAQSRYIFILLLLLLLPNYTCSSYWQWEFVQWRGLQLH